ncbi:flagellar basal body rod protein [Metabacillus sp. KIGAM252]|uniref:Flagellar basal body rod protein n=1 Tax=Metabacillus flavus TaxID=2823519 RepID=A0ABS5LED9_9BACI|nr:flagellar basal body rod protein [Metabacillus flavus]MBS2969121.1 flagellar basal body rod protein [Metabacillus flavus]
MKKAGLIAAAFIAGMILLANTGHIIGLAISAAILYFAFKGFMKTDSTGKKILWAIVGFIALCASASNLPAIIGLAAFYALIKIVKSLKGTKQEREHRSDDPFVNFESQWSEINKSK